MQKYKQLMIIAAFLPFSSGAFAATSIETMITNGLKLLGWAGLIVTAIGVFWGIWSFITGFMGLSKMGDQQAAPDIAKKFWAKIFSGLGAVLAIGILYGAAVYLFGTAQIFSALSMGGNTAESFLQLNIK